MNVITPQDQIPGTFIKSLFLAGPTPRGGARGEWRRQALEHLAELGYDGVVFYPEWDAPKERITGADYTAQLDWEREALRRSDQILFWIPRDMSSLPGLTTNDEWGQWKGRGNVVLGVPAGAEHVDYQIAWARRLGVPTFDDLGNALAEAVKRIGEGAERFGAETCLPLDYWRHQGVQEWLADMRLAGNRLDDALPRWEARMRNGSIFATAVWAKVWIAKEKRHKDIEFAFVRPSVSQGVLFWRHPTTWTESKVVIVKEFRTPVSNSEGLVYETPGGSASKTKDPREVLAAEVREELGLNISLSRFVPLQTRQLQATTLTHKARAFVVELLDDEIARVEASASAGESFGNREDTEMTYPEVMTVAALLADDKVDWANLGIIMKAMMQVIE